MKLFMIRHGQTRANVNQQYSGQADVKLTKEGKQQCRNLASILADIPFDKVFTSDLSRAMDTQKLALPGITGTPLALIREYDIGSLALQNKSEALAKYGPFHGDYTVFGGETTQMVCDRVRTFLAMLEADPCDRVAAFTHGGLINCMLRVVVGDIKAAAIENGNCNIAVFEYKNHTWRLLCWNYGKKL